VREQRVTTPDGHVWYVRRRWARRRPPWKRRADQELGPAERDPGPMLVDGEELLDSLAGFFCFDSEVGVLAILALLALAAVVVTALVAVLLGALQEVVVPFLADNLAVIGAVLAVAAAAWLLDRLTRPWFVEAESARLFHAPRRVWRVQGWWRTRRAFREVVAAIAEGRIDSRHGVVLFADRSKAP
jgi:hypothetical protein